MLLGDHDDEEIPSAFGAREAGCPALALLLRIIWVLERGRRGRCGLLEERVLIGHGLGCRKREENKGEWKRSDEEGEGERARLPHQREREIERERARETETEVCIRD